MSATSTSFDGDTAALIEATLDHVNEEHGDTVLLLANHLVEAPGRSGRARFVGADPDGVDLELTTPDGDDPRRVRLSFDRPAPDAGGLQSMVLSAIAEARTAAPAELPLTSLELELASVETIRTHPARVESVRTLTPAMLEVTLGGLRDLEVPAPDTFVYLLVSLDGAIDPAYSMDDFKAQGSDGPIRGAYYTVRHHDPDQGTITLWVVVHDHPDGVSAWLQDAEPGAELLAWGPRVGFVPPATERFLLVADETGFAAVARIIEAVPSSAKVVALLELADEDDAPPMPSHPGLELRWIVRGGAPGTGDNLLDAVRAADLTEPARWAVFGGAESRQITRIRRYVRDDCGLEAHQVLATGYWRR